MWSRNLTIARSTCLDACIKSDTRFVLPNREPRAHRRAGAAKRAAQQIREEFEDRALLLTTPASVNWRTGGISDPIDVTASSDPVWVIDCAAGSALITNEIEAPRLEHDFRVASLGWDVLSVPWFDDESRVTRACEYANVGPTALLSDSPSIGHNVKDELTRARLVLSDAEQEDLRDLGIVAGIALGAGMDAWRPGITTDFEVASAISAALESEGARAVCLITGGDDRLRSFRHPLAVGDVVNDALMAVVVAKRAGMHVAATRLCTRNADDEIVTLMKSLGSINDAILETSLPGGTWGDTMIALALAYDDAGYHDAWREHFQGGPIGFEQREFELAPTQNNSPFWSVERRAGTAVAWNPSLRGGAKIEETYLIGEGFELLTATPSWPLAEGPHGSLRSAVKVL
jgi:Xaa-Pro dipeptidase